MKVFGKTNILLLQNFHSLKFSRKAISPIIASLLLVAISVVGGSLVFVFAQGFFASSQISGSVQPEYLKILGYDARDLPQLQAHNGEKILPSNCCGIVDGIKNFDERIAIFLQNHSVQEITISELLVDGEIYQYTPSHKLGNWNGGTSPLPTEYVIMTGNNGKPNGDIILDNSPKIQPGQEVTLVIDLGKSIPTGNNIQAKITTTNGNVFVSTLIIGQKSG